MVTAALLATNALAQEPKVAIAIHGGAGTILKSSMTAEKEAAYKNVLSKAVKHGYSLLKEGEDITIITYGAGVHWALEVLDNNPEISADLVDLRTLVPLDRAMVLSSVKKTGKAIVLHEDCMIGGFGADLASIISDECFEFLDAPVKRSASLDTPVPFAYELEDEFLAKARFEKQLVELLAY